MSIVLRRWELDDADWYAVEAKDPDIQRFSNEGDVTAAQLREAITRLREREGVFAIADAQTGSPLGNIGWHRIDGEDAAAEAYYWVAAAARGRGVASAALAALELDAISHGVTSMHLVIDADNVASRSTAGRAGYVLRGPGERRQDTIDTVVYERRLVG